MAEPKGAAPHSAFPIAAETIADLVGGGWKSCVFEPFKGKIEICRLASGPPEVALLKYAPGGRAPRHRHPGLETVLVLDGAQSDENGDYEAGSFVINPENTEHSVWSDDGCVALLTWAKPVQFLE